MCDFNQIGDDRFEIIDSVKQHLLESTNIQKGSAEWEQLDRILHRLWQLGYLKKWSKYKKYKEETKIGENSAKQFIKNIWKERESWNNKGG